MPAPKVKAQGSSPGDTALAAWETALVWISLGAVLVLSARAVSGSLWLDETATYWVVKDGLGNLFSRAWEWPGASAVYDLTAWAGNLLTPVFGLEPALRLPSVLSAVLAALLLFRLGQRLIGRRAALIAVTAFFCIYDVAFAVIDARPYALGLALLTGSAYALVRFLDTADRRYAIVYVATSALLVYTHYLLALGLIAQLIYAWSDRRKLAPYWAAIGVLCLPLAGHAWSLYQTRGAHFFASAPEFPALVRAAAPTALAAAVFLGAIFGGASQPVGRPIPRALLLVWGLLPPTLLFLAALLSDTPLFVARYYLAAAPALALLAGWLLSRTTRAGPACAVLAAVFACLYGSATSRHGVEDWRAASAAINAQAASGDPVLVASGFVEATPRDINRRDVLFSPQMAYPVPNMIRLPERPTESALPADFGGAAHVFLLCYEFQMPYAQWAAARLPGYRAQKVASFGPLDLIRFDK